MYGYSLQFMFKGQAWFDGICQEMIYLSDENFIKFVNDYLDDFFEEETGYISRDYYISKEFLESIEGFQIILKEPERRLVIVKHQINDEIPSK